MTKTLAVLNYLTDHTGLTSMEAFELFGATRLSAIVFSLRKQGYNIVSLDREIVDMYGHTCRFVEYRLIK